MPLSSLNPFDLAEKASKIRLRGGVVGKLCTVMLISAPSLAAIGVAVGNVWVAGACAVMVFGLVLILGLRLVAFAEKHPQAALMEGAEFLIHEKMAYGMKGEPDLVLDNPASTHNPFVSPPPTLTSEANEPDSPETPLLEGQVDG